MIRTCVDRPWLILPCSSSLSGGMKRKLCVAIALIGDPQVVLLDEPSAVSLHCHNPFLRKSRSSSNIFPHTFPVRDLILSVVGISGA